MELGWHHVLRVSCPHRGGVFLQTKTGFADVKAKFVMLVQAHTASVFVTRSSWTSALHVWLPVNFYTSCRCRSSHQGVWKEGECEGCQKQNNVRPWHKGNNFSSLLLDCVCVNLSSFFYPLTLFLVMVSVIAAPECVKASLLWRHMTWCTCSATWGQLTFCAGWACSSRCFPIIWVSPHSCSIYNVIFFFFFLKTNIWHCCNSTIQH